MQNNNKKQISNFEIHASIVFQLGEDLISDEVQALVELIKNSYDACSQYAKDISVLVKEGSNKKSKK